MAQACGAGTISATTKDNAMSKQDPSPRNLTFEEAFKQLNEVVERLEQGELPLDEAVRFYEKGTQLAQLCEDQLKDAELRVTQWQGGGQEDISSD